MDSKLRIRLKAGAYFILHGIAFPIQGASYFQRYTIPGFPDGRTVLGAATAWAARCAHPQHAVVGIGPVLGCVGDQPALRHELVGAIHYR